MSSYVMKTVKIPIDRCSWHYRTSDASSIAGNFFTNEDSYKISYIWDGNKDSFARIIDYSSPNNTWGVMAFHLNTKDIPANARPWSVNVKPYIVYGAVLSSDYNAGITLYTNEPSFASATKTKPSSLYSGNSTQTIPLGISSSWSSYRTACVNNSVYLVFRLRCGSSIDTYRRFNELHTEWTYRIYSFSVSSGTTIGGTVKGKGEYEELSTCTLTAVPDEGYEFVGWSNGEITPSISFTVTADVTITPTFKKKIYSLSVMSENDIYGEVTGSGNYEYESEVTISATEKDGYRFSHWSDGNTDKTRTVIVKSDMTYTAHFVVATPIFVSIKINPNPASLNQGYLISVEVV